MPELNKGSQLANNITELTAIAPLIPGGADRLRAVFADRKRQEKQGKPSPIERIETIHYARWVIIDGGERLLFTSNFDGDLEDYLEDFAERDEAPLNAIFGACIGWPGARPVAGFIRYVRDHQVPATYYYAAYPRYTVKEVKRGLYWKQETEEFLKALAALREAQASGSAEILDLNAFLKKMDGAINSFLKALAKPTPWPL